MKLSEVINIEFVRSTINLFEEKSEDKSTNDAKNKAREAAISVILGCDKIARDKFIDDDQVGNRWKIIETSLRRSLASIPLSITSEMNLEFSYVKHRGGRSKNFDFEAVYTHKPDRREYVKAVEFKFGKSIYDQPQFLSIYANNSSFITPESQSFPNFFYDNFAPDLVPHAKVNLPSKDLYLSKIFGTARNELPFFKNLYEFKMKSDLNRATLKNISDFAIDAYLRTFPELTNCLDYESINRMFSPQIDKYFISWNYESMSANVEYFLKNDMQVMDTIDLKKNSSELFSSLVFTNLNGKKIEALLRWKNHACILGPAWQVKLRRN